MDIEVLGSPIKGIVEVHPLGTFALGSNAGGGGGIALLFASVEEAEAAAAALRALGARAERVSRSCDWRARDGRYLPTVEVPRAAHVLQRRGGPVDGASWQCADALAALTR